MKYLDSLVKLGLSKDQAKIYEILVSSNVLPARLVSQKSLVGRELTYIVLKQLEDMGLVERLEQGKVILFRAKHPSNIKKFLEEKKTELLESERAYQDSITGLIGDFNISHHKPFIRFYEGVEGLQKTYGHILKNAREVRVIRSLFDYDNKEIRESVTSQLKKQSLKGIRSFVISPHLPHMKPDILSHNIERKITRKVVSKEKFTMPAQVIIYNDTVSITSMKNEIITTIIENKDIAETFRNMFKYMWDADL